MTQKTVKALVPLVVLLCGAAFTWFSGLNEIQAPVESSPSPASTATALANIQKDSSLYSVTDVVDGDTIKVTIENTAETLRLIGMDTPEVVDPRKPVQCFGREASNKAKELLTGKSVRLEADPTQSERDKYGRLLRYAYLEDGTSYNLLMISEGYAHEYTYDSNPYRYQQQYKEAESSAREQEKGLWATSSCAGNTQQTAQGTIPPSPSPAQSLQATAPDAIDYDCSDFESQSEAQEYFDSQGGSQSNNVDNLDANHDGIACGSPS